MQSLQMSARDLCAGWMNIQGLGLLQWNLGHLLGLPELDPGGEAA